MTDEYAIAKARQENILRESGKNHWTILRPCITYSKSRFQYGTLEANTLCLRALQGVPVIMAREILSKHTTMTWAGDTARPISKLALNEKAMGEDFNVATSEHHTWEEIGAYYKEFIGLQTAPVDLDVYTRVVGGIYQVKYDRLLNRILDTRKMLRATGESQAGFTSTRDGLKRELEAFQREPCFQYPDPVMNAAMDRVTGASISLRGFGLRQRAEYYAERLGVFQSLLRIRSMLGGFQSRRTVRS